MSPRLRRLLGIVASLAVLVVLLLANRGGTDDPSSSASRTTVPSEGAAAETVTETVPDTGTVADTDAADTVVDPSEVCVDGDPPTVDVGDLPPEALDTLELIDEGGPFPYDQDGSTFQNRERLLPLYERGYYEEYTVETPGSDDRGARRIVTGECGEAWYTDDHYDSFSLIVGAA